MPQRRPASRQVLQDRARQSGPAAPAAPDRAPELNDPPRLAGCARPWSRRATRRRRTGRRSASRLPTSSTRSTSRHPQPAGGAADRPRACLADIEHVIRTCGAHLLRFVPKNGFIPTYAAFNLLGDPDMRGREFLMALTGLDARGYKNSTLLFNLARIFIARSPARALINPPWTGHRRADVAADADPPSLGLLRRVLHRSAFELRRNRPRLIGETAASRRAISDMVDFCLRLAARKCRRVTARPSASSPRWRRCRIRASRGFSRRSSRISASASTCRTATPPRARSRPPRKPAPPIRSSISRCWTSMLDFRCVQGANEPRVTVALNDHIDYDGGIVTWIDNLSGDRPLWQRPRSDAQSRRPRSQLSQSLRAGRSSRRRSGWIPCIASSASRGGWSQAARSPIRARTSTICRNFTPPISAAAMPHSPRCRRLRSRRSIPTARSPSSGRGCWPMCRTN